jgi:hypothetical protein
MTLRHATTRCVMGSTGALEYPGGWSDRYVLDVQVQMSDPTVQLPAPDLVLPSLRRTERPVQDAMECHGAHQPRADLDAVCQITVQAPASQAQAPFAMGAMDDCFRLGTGVAL